MAKQPPHGDDKSKKTHPFNMRPEDFKAPKTPRPAPPQETIPNMSLDDDEGVLDAAEVIEEEALPVDEAGPTSDEAANVLLDDDAPSIKKPHPTPTPVSDVFLGEDEPEEATPVSDALEAGEVVEEAEPIEEAAEIFEDEVLEADEASAVLGVTQPMPPKSEPDLNAMFGEAEAAEEAEEVEEAEEFADEAEEVFAEPPIDINEPSVMLSGVEPMGEAVQSSPEPIHAFAGDAALPPADEIVHASEVVATSDDPAIAPMSDVVATHEPIEQGVAHVPSDIVVAHEPIEHAPEMPAVTPGAAAPASDALAAEEVVEAASAVEEAEEAVEAASAVEEAEEFAEAAPASDVFAAEEAEEAVEAASAVEAEEAQEAEEAVEAEEVFAEDADEAMPASAVIESGEIAEEVAEAVEASSATREAEEVFAEDVEAEEVGPITASSGSDVFGPASGKKPLSGVNKTAGHDKTIAFEGPPSSSARRPDSDVLVTEEEVVGSPEASAVDLGEMPKKGSSVAGIDKVAEALESGTDLGGHAKPAPSVEFDELLDDLADSDDHEAVEAVEAVDADESTEMDAGVIDDDFDSPKPAAKKGKKSAVKATGDDIDLDDVFGEDEAAEAAEAEDAGEAVAAETSEEEAAAIFDEDPEAEAVATAATDDEAVGVFSEETADEEVETKGKKGKKAHKKDEDEEDEEESKAKKKKGKKEKTAPASSGSGILGWVGGMFIAVLLLGGGFGAALFLAPDAVRGLVDMTAGEQKGAGPIVPKGNDGGGGGKKKEKIDEARGALASGDYKNVFESLKGTTNENELAVLGEARWLEYLQQQEAKNEPLDKDAPAVKQALADLQKSSNKPLAKRIETQLSASTKEKELSEQLNTMTMEKATAEKQLGDAIKAKKSADQAFDSIAAVLVKANVIADKTKFEIGSLDKFLKGLGADKASLDKLNTLLEKEVKKTGEAGLMELLAARDQADKNLAAINKALEGANVKDNGAKGVQELATSREKLQTEVKGLDALMAQAVKELTDGNILPPGADPRKQLVEGAKLARVKSESPLSIPIAQLGMSLGGIGSGASKMVEDIFGSAKSATELKWYQAREKLIQTPQQKMDTNIAILQDRTRNNPAELKAIALEADWVLDPESKSDPEARAKAQYVKGLALRNQEKYAEARTRFEQALKAASADAKGWKQLLERSNKELTDSSYYYLPRIERLQAEGNHAAALAEVNAALKAMPDDGRLHALRGLIRIQATLAKGSKLDAQVEQDVRTDAVNAAKDGRTPAESAYLLGRLEEEFGKFDAAEKQYRMAIKLHDDAKGPAEIAGRYRVALGRLLLRERGEAAPVAPPKIEEKDEKKDAEPQSSNRNLREEFTSLVQSLSILAAHTVSFQQPGDAEDARLKEVIEEAEKLKASKNPKLQGQGYCLMGSALSKLGKRTEGLKEYAKGLELLYPGIETKEINELIEAHPAFFQPDSTGVANPIMAERHFGEGSHLFWKAMLNPTAKTALQDFKEAEAQFLQAIKYYDKDARYQYYLGFAQLQQKSRNKRDSALFAFEKGARMEAAAVQSNPFAAREINQSLERVQGEMREMLNQYRYRPSTEPETKKSETD